VLKYYNIFLKIFQKGKQIFSSFEFKCLLMVVSKIGWTLKSDN